MAVILGAVGALLIPILTLLFVFALSDNASDHDFRVLKPAKARPPTDWALPSKRAA
jgi:hypothetical protein